MADRAVAAVTGKGGAASPPPNGLVASRRRSLSGEDAASPFSGEDAAAPFSGEDAAAPLGVAARWHLWQSPRAVAGGDVRGVLQYVPLFRGRTFVVVLDHGLLPEPAVAETLLDLKALQDIGVRLAIGVLGGDVDALAEWLTELEVKFARATASPGEAEAVGECGTIIGRGQAAVLDCGGLEALGPEMTAFCSGLGAGKLLALVNGPGVVRDGEPLHAVPSAQVDAVEGPLEGADMLRAAAAACAAGVPRVHVLDGRRQGVLADELFSYEGVGTMVHADSYREIRPLRDEDIPELLAMIGRSVRRSHLVPRHYEEIESQADDFLVMCLDDNVTGCVALHEYGGGVGEVACLYVKQSHEKLGYGQTLVEAAEDKARERRLTSIFALTNRAAGFFGERLGYAQGGLEIVPAARRAKLEQSGRESVVMVKEL